MVKQFPILTVVSTLIGLAGFAHSSTVFGQEESAEKSPKKVPVDQPQTDTSTDATTDVKVLADKPTVKDDVNSDVTISARIHVGWDMTHLTEEPIGATEQLSNEFHVRRARLKLTWRPYRWLKGVVQIDAAEAFELGGSLLRDAYVQLSPVRQFEIKVGQFKKPFSGLELRSPRRRKLINRGPGNDLIIEDLGYGDRDLGLQIAGRLSRSAKLDYALGVFNGNGANIAEEGMSKDLVARLQIRPVKQFAVGANGTMKWFNDPVDRQPSRAWAAGGDVMVSAKGFKLALEALTGQNHRAYLYSSTIAADSSPLFIDVTAIVSYKYSFETQLPFGFEPVFKFEMLEPDSSIIEDHVLVFTPGINTYIGKYFRLMINSEITRSARNSEPEIPDAEVLMLLACLDI